MTNGLIINEKEFMCLPARKQMCLLYQNQLETMSMINGYKLYYKITAIIGAALISGMAILFKLELGA
jgi:hypothetical protein